MLPSSLRLNREEFTRLTTTSGLQVVFNRLGTLKYLKEGNDSGKFTVVTSSKHEKSAVLRNKLRRRIYTLFRTIRPAISGVLYVSKQSYKMEYREITSLLNDLLAKNR